MKSAISGKKHKSHKEKRNEHVLLKEDMLFEKINVTKSQVEVTRNTEGGNNNHNPYLVGEEGAKCEPHC